MEKIQNPINTVKIVDYFPEDITENFDFSYVGSPSIGTTSDSIDTESKTITWDIGTLKGDEVATLKYKLKIKDMKNTELLNKTIATNDKVVLTYKDTESKDYKVELASSPEIQLSEIKNSNENGTDVDNSIAPGRLPNTGVSMTIIISAIIVSLIALIFYKQFNKFKDIK